MLIMVQEGKNGPEKDLMKYVGKEEKKTKKFCGMENHYSFGFVKKRAFRWYPLYIFQKFLMGRNEKKKYFFLAILPFRCEK